MPVGESSPVDQSPISLTQVSAVGAAIVVAALAYRGAVAVARIAIRELDYRVGGDLDTWLGNRR